VLISSPKGQAKKLIVSGKGIFLCEGTNQPKRLNEIKNQGSLQIALRA